MKPVKEKPDRKIKIKSSTAIDSSLLLFVFFFLLFLNVGLMGGAPCPAEILRKLRTDMNMKEITVSNSK